MVSLLAVDALILSSLVFTYKGGICRNAVKQEYWAQLNTEVDQCEFSFAHAIPYFLALLCWSTAAVSLWWIQGPIKVQNVLGASDGQTIVNVMEDEPSIVLTPVEEEEAAVVEASTEEEEADEEAA